MSYTQAVCEETLQEKRVNDSKEPEATTLLLKKFPAGPDG
jgi:hypothetical protein